MKMISLVSATLLFASINTSAGIKEGGADSFPLMSGTYQAENCKPRNPEEGCPTITIDPVTQTDGTQSAEGMLNGGDVMIRYKLKATYTKLTKGYIYEVNFKSEWDEASTWILIPAAHKLINVKTGLVLVRAQSR